MHNENLNQPHMSCCLSSSESEFAMEFMRNENSSLSSAQIIFTFTDEKNHVEDKNRGVPLKTLVRSTNSSNSIIPFLLKSTL